MSKDWIKMLLLQGGLKMKKTSPAAVHMAGLEDPGDSNYLFLGE